MEHNNSMDTTREHNVCVFDGATMDFRVWKERIELYLMANRLYTGILDNEDAGDKKTLPSRSLACYAIISLNLSDSTRDVIRRLNTKDPRVCWEALTRAFDQESPSMKMVLLDHLLQLRVQRCGGTASVNGDQVRRGPVDCLVSERIAQSIRGFLLHSTEWGDGAEIGGDLY
jgi:hypothetical protein